ncbi:rhodanese-like domain-containing protein [Reichenbachiella carrageenanivorans]|uniref:Rhodanese-like domain-containing protein n=1 Tax=Reichenbachiella carrageenanivorans TaxID=2979869 RepID=A0ABY6D0E1_9BACT|nr:rhodanese-like domain-containing protein [Reichenbachiella carrageenanivorans]UXX79095.1 rhodanese-like domain-containing protein [Reichenbachiella carrageenanivorans]
MRYWLTIFCLVPFTLQAQDDKSDKQEAKFYRMVDGLLDHAVEEVKVQDGIPENAVLLDARSEEEYKVSHLAHARWVGYDDFDVRTILDVDKNAEILVYCSVGYRSEKVAEQLKSAGYTNAKNLYGGLFDWVNHGLPVVDSLGHPTQQVHGYNLLWGRWVTKGEVVY